MLKSRLFDLLGSLNEAEFKKFGEYISSPYFNKSKVLIKLYSIYKKHYPEFSDEGFLKSKIFSKLFPGKPFNESLLRNYNSDLLALGEKFLSQVNFNRNGNNHYRHLLNELNIRGINSLFKSNYGTVMNLLDSSIIKDTMYHYDRYFIKQEKEQNSLNLKELSGEDMRDSEISIINFLFSVMLEMYAYNINQIEVNKIKYDFLILNELITLVESKKHLLDPVVLIHYYRLMLHYTGKPVYFDLLKRQAEEHSDLSGEENHFDTYICLINYVKKFKDMNSTETIRELFDLRKVMIEKYILEGKNFISQNIFLSQVRSAIKLEYYDWLAEFIETYKNSLPENIKHNTYHYSLALYYFSIKKYQEALLNISLISGNVLEPLEIKNLSVRIYWHLNDFERLLSGLLLYKQYLAKNRKIDKVTLKKHKGFTVIMDKLFKYKFDKKNIDLIALEKQADNTEILYNRWLLNEIREFKK